MSGIERLYQLHNRGEFALTELEYDKYMPFLSSGILAAEIAKTEVKQTGEWVAESKKRFDGTGSAEAEARLAMMLIDAWVLMHGASIKGVKIKAIPFIPELKRMIAAKLMHQRRLETMKAKSKPFTSVQKGVGTGVEDPFLKVFLDMK